MSVGKPRSTTELLGLLAICISVIGGLYGGGQFVYGLVDKLATKNFHNEDMTAQMAPIQKSVSAIESSVLVPRIQNILDLKCRTNGDIPDAVEGILQRSLQRYKAIEEREFDVGGCRNGERITSYEMTTSPQ